MEHVQPREARMNNKKLCSTEVSHGTTCTTQHHSKWLSQRDDPLGQSCELSHCIRHYSIFQLHA